MKYLFFDTETTGLPKNWRAKMSEVDNWPRIIQLACAMYDEYGQELESFEILVKPDGWEVPSGQFWIDNGFSQQECLEIGQPIADVLDLFIRYHDESNALIAHNMSYDYNVLGAEMIRAKKRCKEVLTKFCTKELGTDYCKLDGQYGYKWPSLEELYFKLFG